MNFVQLKLDTDSFAIDYIEAILESVVGMARMNSIEWYNNFPYVYLDATNIQTKWLLKWLATLGWLGNEVVDTGEIVPFD